MSDLGGHAPIRLDGLVRHGNPAAPALTYRDETISYGELSAQVTAAAAGLLGLGLGRGDRVVVYLEKRIETVVAMLAVSAAGGVLVPANPVLKPAQVGYAATHCTARVLITTPERYQATAPELSEHIEHVVLVGVDEPVEPNRVGPRLITWAGLGAAATDLPAVIDSDVAAIFYTSGSTGRPKGVVLSHRNLIAGAQSVAGYLGHTADDVVLAVLPLSFDAGFSQLTTSFAAGAHVVLVNYLLPREIVRLCARHSVTALTCVPPLWLQLIGQNWPPDATASLRYFANTGGRMPRHALARLREIFPAAQPFLMYGLTEAFRSTYLDPAQARRRPDSIGRAIPNAEVLVLRPDGSECAPGEHGEIVHRGALVAQGYWNDPAATAARFRPYPLDAAPTHAERAVWSGDLAYRDDDGFLYFVSRTDEMIKASGYRVSPTEIEEVAYASGLVAQAAAFGLPDERLGQRIVLAVAGPDGRDCDVQTLRKSLAQELPGYLVPAQIEVLPALPRSANGKFDRVALRARLGP